MPNDDEKIKIIMETHQEINHRGIEETYYALKSKFYWPGIKNTIINCLKKCEICSINNRKRRIGNRFVTTSKIFEKVALDIMQVSENNKFYLLVLVDYFSRFLKLFVLENRKSDEIIFNLKNYFNAIGYPQTIITDNAKEFVSEKFKKFCKEEDMRHETVSIESHRSNGRVERIIRTIRDSFNKNNEADIHKKTLKVVDSYNNTYHSAIKCTPLEALEDVSGMAAIENSIHGRYIKRFKRKKEEDFNVNTEVRIAKFENLGKNTKVKSGRFTEKGMVLGKFENGSYLIKKSNGKIVKLSEKKIKKINNI